MIDGTYTLARDIANPKPDRRVNQDRLTSWRGWVTWPAGMIFIVESDREFQFPRIFPRGSYSMEALFGEDIPEEMPGLLVPMKEKPSDLLIRLHGHSAAGRYAMEILDRIGLTLERIIAHVEEIDEGEAEREEAHP